MYTNKTIKIPRTYFKAITTSLGSHVGIYKVNSLSFSFSFIFDEALQLIETPTIKQSIKSFSYIIVPTFSYPFKILQNYYIIIFDNSLTYIMVNPTHITFLSSRDRFKLSSGRLCAFGLEFSPQVNMLHDSGFVSFENLAIRTDSKVIYPDINTNNPVATTRSWSVDVSGKSDMKEHPSFFILDKFKRLVSPIKILPIVFGDVYRNVHPLSRSKSSQSNLLKRESEKVSIKTNWTIFYHRFLFKVSRFKISRSLTNCFNSKISSEIEMLTNLFVNKMMKFESIAYFSFKTFVNSILNSQKESIVHIKQFLIMLNFQLYSSDSFHYSMMKYNSYINLMYKEMINLNE